jgi:hypothetical protein
MRGINNGHKVAQAAARAVLVFGQEADMHAQQAFVSFLMDPGALACRRLPWLPYCD